VYNSFELNESVRRALGLYSQSLIKIAFAYLKNTADAEEVAQDVFLAYLLKRPVFENGEHEKAWLIRTTINCFTTDDVATGKVNATNIYNNMAPRQ